MRCSKTLARGRQCVHVKGIDHRHSHTWQPGDARYLDIYGHLIDMETGEATGVTHFGTEQIIRRIIAQRDERDKQAHARRVLETMYGARFGDGGQVHACPPTDGYRWHYEGQLVAIGTDANGHDVEFDFGTGRIKRIYSLNQRAEVVAYARRFGAAKASRKFGVPAATVRKWSQRAGK